MAFSLLSLGGGVDNLSLPEVEPESDFSASLGCSSAFLYILCKLVILNNFADIYVLNYDGWYFIWHDYASAVVIAKY